MKRVNLTNKHKPLRNYHYRKKTAREKIHGIFIILRYMMFGNRAILSVK